ncbi:winged helix-turn-helix domain-containing protein [Solirhodobacter olei]|uniref:winged helix-turn-helix domain-containing protein n=1 Tax=Solirhodobacter olei TaxID=2493082 RepID=UPI000FDBB183|nr:crosslink repair DNA glycosylase YcaQ family protein [Solirhodobacter olei]
MTARPLIQNARARRLFLDRHLLGDVVPGKPDAAALLDLITRLGFVQIDSINTVARAHHMILRARMPGYRPATLDRLLEDHRSLFEHWTHDASVIPTEFFPHWRLRFDRSRETLADRWRTWRDPAYLDKLDEVLAKVAEGGPVTSGEAGEDEPRSSGGWWEWHPSKTALEYLWRTGALAVARREGFRKVYDLTERVIPEPHLTHRPEAEHTIDWACNAAIDRLGFATSGEIAAFFATVSPEEAKRWCARELACGALIEVDVEGADGARRRSFARPSLPGEDAAEPTGRLRILSPFDPALRDRNRAERLFGFHYRIEVFVPEPKRKYGYYVFPVIEGDRITGRIDAKADRQAGALAVRAFWPERGVKMGAGRIRRLEVELDRLARFSGCDRVDLAPDWLRESL